MPAILPQYLQKNENNFTHHSSIRKLLKKLAQNRTLNHYAQECNQDLYKILSTFHSINSDEIYIDNGLETTFLSLFKSIKIDFQPNYIFLLSPYWSHYQNLLKNSFLPAPQPCQDLENLTDQLNSKKHTLIILTNPNNPTGTSYPENQIKQLICQFPQHLFVIDEAYAGFGSIDYQNSLLIKLAIKSNNLIIARTFSKFFGIPGLRIGYLITNHKNIEKYRLSPTYLGINSFSQPIVIELLKNYSFYLKRAENIKNVRQKFFLSLSKKSLFTPYCSEANFILVKINQPFKNQELNQYLIDHGFLVKFFTDSNLNDHIRITLAPLPILKRLQSVIEKYFEK